MPSNVSQKPDAKRKTTAKMRSQGCAGEVNTYETAEANAKMNPNTLMLLGVKPSLWAILASVVRSSWTFFFNLVSKFFSTKQVLLVNRGLAVEKPFLPICWTFIR
jgi:hypothetical protein